MRILVDPSSVHCLNLGDVAMLQVTVKRLRQFWPKAEIYVFNDSPDLLKSYCPSAIPLPSVGRATFYSIAAILTRFGRRFAQPRLSEADVAWRHRWPRLVEKLTLLREGEEAASEVCRFTTLVQSCDLVVASGAGQITTAFGDPSTLVLNTMELAAQHGVPTAIFGQGIGPIDEPCLRMRAQKVLPKINLICLREVVTGPKLLESLGVPRKNVVVTGDDAIDTVYRRHLHQVGNAIGVNLRVSWYSDIPNDSLLAMRRLLQGAARAVGAPLLAVPISRHSEENDLAICESLFEGYERVLHPVHNLETVEGLVDEIGRCRLVVTTSYHGGVFALSQGVPVVAWVKSKYFAAKLYGLANQFGVGCEVVTLEDDNLAERFTSAVISLWNSADQVRPRLLQAAKRQVETSEAAYERVRLLVDGDGELPVDVDPLYAEAFTH